ncbi:MAG: deoxyguanosinetriphosphate triphosphohydrolase [Alphaproteobacteria bacterium]
MKKENLSNCASLPEASLGRLFEEEESKDRTVFQRDRDRIIHSSAFRLMKSKTQVFVNHEGESFRTRLTHSLEVAQIARSVSRNFGLNEDLAEALALAHDLGHPPFGHAGEVVLKDCMKPYGGFDHNAHALKIVTKLEKRYATFDGLNLTWETLEGLVKHNGPLVIDGDDSNLFWFIKEYNQKHNLKLDTLPSAEAQLAAVADDIAYNNHDIDDGFMAGLFTIKELKEVPLVGEVINSLQKQYTDIEDKVLIHETSRNLIKVMIKDLISETFARYKDLGSPKSSEEVRNLKSPVVSFSENMQKNDKELKNFLFPHMYRHYKVMRMTNKAKKALKDLFNLFLSEPRLLPQEWQKRTRKNENNVNAEVVCDYLARMTDAFAIEEYSKLFDLKTLI